MKTYPRAELRKRNIVKTFPQSGITEVELHEDICLRVELWKPNFKQTFPQNGIMKVEIREDFIP